MHRIHFSGSYIVRMATCVLKSATVHRDGLDGTVPINVKLVATAMIALRPVNVLMAQNVTMSQVGLHYLFIVVTFSVLS